jgi:hypothetical protein
VGWALEARRRPQLLTGGAAAVLSGAPLTLLPPFFYDALVYHLGLPWSWLVNGNVTPTAHNLFSNFPVAVPSVYLLPVSWKTPEAAAGLHWLCLVVVLVTALRLADRLGAASLRWLAPLLLIGCWHLVWVGSLAATDLLVTVCILAAVEASVALAEDAIDRWLDLSLACGLALATKYPAAVPVAAVLVVTAVLLRRRPALLLAIGAVTAASASLVWIRNLVLTGNPVYPMLWPLLGGSGWTEVDQQRFAGLVFEGVDGLSSLATGLVRLVRPPGGLGWWALAALPLVVVSLSGQGPEGRLRRIVAAIAGLAMVGWLATSQTTRYAFPLAGLVAVLAAVGASRLRRVPLAVALVVSGAAVVVGALDLGAHLLGRLQVQQAWLGRVSRDEWRHRVTVNDPLPAYRLAGSTLPPSSRLLVVGEGRPFGCPLPHHVSSPYDLQAIQELIQEVGSPSEAASRLAAAGLTHLVINWGELERLGGADFQLLRWHTDEDRDRWRGFLERWTVPSGGEGPCEIRALAAPPPEQ